MYRRRVWAGRREDEVIGRLELIVLGLLNRRESDGRKALNIVAVRIAQILLMDKAANVLLRADRRPNKSVLEQLGILVLHLDQRIR